ncbi:similar to Saccharomyces cerevisiae YDR522C SPS2 Protein expressed during sporulation, redundant with Sps22p for organization of the beta-glucan layer of the spore wall [Maudiozyma saulgeensis]|uniref:Similar to Saccharomyces cerevisiae YDR522C SPS2 Protein expressed during sporulation, redundant with Sps22p for organization of the beta-glucan layer of the spore wall n=1 Tax=Maudiozyma saulgeensis TaxID=1789683 RepID=A0A1X7R6Y2_9SACH|nr:similar to Saccharomyces cerevisiae YDR522C SPS2 Protein expressed during sporulation, redundant with Sps22p for organization of the beta-glucan layer of the spore wall [Kazachstania saulgeensis]
MKFLTANTIIFPIFLGNAWASYLLQNELIGKIKQSEAVAISAMSTTQELCHKKDHNIEKQEDLTNLARTCSEIYGNLAISNNYQEKFVDLGDIEKIRGDFKVQGSSSIVSISAPKLETVGQKLEFKNLTSLVSTKIGLLKNVKTVELVTLPLLKEVSINNNINKMNKIVISDTSLQSVDFFSNIEQTDLLEINNNRYLGRVELKVKTVNNKLNIYSNADDTNIQLPILHSTGDLSIRNAGALNLQSLEFVNKSLDIIENSITELNLKNLKKISGTAAIIDNKKLNEIHSENLTHIEGGLLVINNEDLKSMDFLPEVHTIGGAIKYGGSFDKVSFPKLKVIKGGANFVTESNKFNCTALLNPFIERHVIRGENLTCSSNLKGEDKINKHGSSKLSYGTLTTGTYNPNNSSKTYSTETDSVNSLTSISSTPQKTVNADKMKKKNDAFKSSSYTATNLIGWLVVAFLFFSTL